MLKTAIRTCRYHLVRCTQHESDSIRDDGSENPPSPKRQPFVRRAAETLDQRREFTHTLAQSSEMTECDSESFRSLTPNQSICKVPLNFCSNFCCIRRAISLAHSHSKHMTKHTCSRLSLGTSWQIALNNRPHWPVSQCQHAWIRKLEWWLLLNRVAYFMHMTIPVHAPPVSGSAFIILRGQERRTVEYLDYSPTVAEDDDLQQHLFSGRHCGVNLQTGRK